MISAPAHLIEIKNTFIVKSISKLVLKLKRLNIYRQTYKIGIQVKQDEITKPFVR